MAVGIAEVYAAPGKRGDKIWCGLEMNGQRYVAWGATDVDGLAQGNARGVLEFSNVSRNTKKPVFDVQIEKINKGYRLVGRYEVDFSTGKAFWAGNRKANASVEAKAPEASSAPAPEKPKIVMKRPTAPMWVW
ncbi:hypothetical protein AQ621_16785 (plasmid) [Marinobacter sp. P4B1]|nr:hypothetical protein AQ621_16785 [Marinobacter sp. P4B1]